MEIRSATMHTKFAGAHVKQMYWVAAGVGMMFLVSLVNYQALLDQIHWFYVASSRIARCCTSVWDQGPRRAALDQDAGGESLSASEWVN